MRLRISDPALRTDFARHFERVGFTVEPRDDAILVERPDAPDPAQLDGRSMRMLTSGR
jgi:hypothetical protein